MQTKQATAAYELFVEMHADYTHQSPDQMRAAISPDEFERQVRDLHYRWLSGEFSFGRFTEIIGVPHAELWAILDALALPLHK